MVTSDLFVAGMVSTSITLTWALLLMILHPDVQREPSLGVGWDGGGRGWTAWGPLSLVCPPEAPSRGWDMAQR